MTIAPFITLKPSRLAAALEEVMGSDGLNAEQKLNAQIVLLNIGAESVRNMSQEASLRGTTHARKLSPAYSVPRVGPDEAAVYNLVKKGDAEAIKAVISPEAATTTTHPDTARPPRMVENNHTVIEILGHLDLQTQQEIQRTGVLDDKTRESVADLLAETKELAKRPRKKRTRADEIDETAVGFISTIMKAADKQMDIMKIRMAILDGGAGEREFEFADVKQIKAAAALLGQFNTWAVDGDGKPTCHAYDAEMLIPAIKGETHRQYLELLKTLPDMLGDLNIAQWRRRFERSVDYLLGNESKGITGLKELAAIRMEGKEIKDPEDDAFKKLDGRIGGLNQAQAAFELEREESTHANRKIKQRATDLAQQNSKLYKQKQKEVIPGSGGKTVLDLLKEDLAGQFKEELGNMLDEIYKAGEPNLYPVHKKVAESLYYKLESYGNFAIHPQRRQNAEQYEETLIYLLESNADFKKIIAKALDVDEGILPAMARENDAFFTSIVTAFAELTSKKPEEMSNMILGVEDAKGYFKPGTFKYLASKLEQKLKTDDRGEETLVVQPLEQRQIRALDDLGYFNMARLYPEAFNPGGFVIAEFAQPGIEVLEENDPDAIREDVSRKAKTDMLLNIAFARVMGAPDLPVIPLHEDPATMQHIAAAQPELYNAEVMDYFVTQLGLKGEGVAQRAEALAVRYLDKSGQPQLLSAYQDAQNDGLTDQDLKAAGIDIPTLKNTFVIEFGDDMDACSDINKRAKIIGSRSVEESQQERALERAKMAAAVDALQRRPLVIGGKNYLIRKAKYPGQGGTIPRATDVPLNARQATWQGEHADNLTPTSLGHEMHNRTMGRLYLSQESARIGLEKMEREEAPVLAEKQAAEEAMALRALKKLSPAEKAAIQPMPLRTYSRLSGKKKAAREALAETAQSKLSPEELAAIQGMTQRAEDEKINKDRIRPLDRKEHEALMRRLGSEVPHHTGNRLGLRPHRLLDSEQELMDITVAERIASTRDDQRYNDWLTLYAGPAPNDSARPNKKSGGSSEENFDANRAIGEAAKEAGIWANVIGLSTLFEFSSQGAAKGEVTLASAQELQRWKENDPSMQHLFTVAALTAVLVNLEEEWLRGGIDYRRDDKGKVWLTKRDKVKGEVTVELDTLTKAYNSSEVRGEESEIKKVREYKDKKTGIAFGAGDLVMAHLTEQFLRLEKGLHAVYPGKKSLLDIFPKEHHDDILAVKNIYDQMLKLLRETKGNKDEKRQLLEREYYTLFERGEGQFPLPRLLEQMLDRSQDREAGRSAAA